MKWFQGTFTKINNLISGHKQFNVLLVGLEEAGKTTVIYKLKNYPKEYLITPTLFIYQDSIEYENTTFLITEVTGKSRLRQLWRYYFKNSHAVIYVLDSSNRFEFGDSKAALMDLLEELNDLPFLILANKRDIPESMTVREITGQLTDLLEKHGDRCFVQATSATEGIGLKEGLNWLKKQLLK